MTKKKILGASGGQTIAQHDIERMADEAERGYSRCDWKGFSFLGSRIEPGALDQCAATAPDPHLKIQFGWPPTRTGQKLFCRAK
jgi:hypothetical protein